MPFQIIIGKQVEGDKLEFKEVDGASQKIELKDIIKTINNQKANNDFGLEKEITFRFLSQKKRWFLNIISIFSFIGIGLGVAVLIVVMSVMNGFRTELVNKIIGFNAHMTVKPYENKITKEKIDNQNLKSISESLIFTNSGEGIMIKKDITKGILLRGYFAKDFSKLDIVNNGNFLAVKINYQIILYL